MSEYLQANASELRPGQWVIVHGAVRTASGGLRVIDGISGLPLEGQVCEDCDKSVTGSVCVRHQPGGCHYTYGPEHVFPAGGRS